MKINKTQDHSKGKLFSVSLQNTQVDFVVTRHCIERMRKWDISEQALSETLLDPEEVVIGHRGRYIAHRRYGEHVVRAIYEYEDGSPIVITTYFPYAKQYYKGGGHYEDKIFP